MTQEFTIFSFSNLSFKFRCFILFLIIGLTDQRSIFFFQIPNLTSGTKPNKLMPSLIKHKSFYLLFICSFLFFSVSLLFIVFFLFHFKFSSSIHMYSLSFFIATLLDSNFFPKPSKKSFQLDPKLTGC